MKRPALFALISALATFMPPALGAAGDSQAKLTAEQIRKATADIDEERLKHPKPGEWITYNGSPNEQRYSPLDQINDKTVSDLKPVWRFPTGSNRGLEATPLVVDGVMYTTAPWSVVY